MSLLLVIALAAAPKGQTVTVALHWEERLKITSNGRSIDDNTLLDTRAKLKRAPDGSVEVEAKGQPSFTVRDDSGAPAFVFKEKPSSVAVDQVLRRAFGRLVVPDPEREAMSSCTPETEAATGRWLKTAVARLNGSEPSEVELSALAVKCTPAKGGARLDVSFAAKAPRATLTITLEQKGTLTVDRTLWFTQWKVMGPVHVTGGDVTVEGSFSSSLTAK